MEACSFFIKEPHDYFGKWNEEFENNNDIYLELGCGRGKFITENALNNKDINYIGIDIKDEVLIYDIKKVISENINNVRITALDISLVDEIFSKDEISRIYINFCNPWPKRRHNKRRLTYTEFLNKYKKFLKKGAEIWFKTDDEGLFNDSVKYFNEAGFKIENIYYDLENSNFEENIKTEYEEKFESIGKNIMFLIAKLND